MIEDFRICDRLEMPTNASNLDHFRVSVGRNKEILQWTYKRCNWRCDQHRQSIDVSNSANRRVSTATITKAGMDIQSSGPIFAFFNWVAKNRAATTIMLRIETTQATVTSL